MNKNKIFAIIAVSILVAVVAYAVYDFGGNIFDSNPANNQTLTSAQLASLNVTGSGTTIDRASSTIYVNNSSTLLVMMGPMNMGSMYSFEMYGLLNPNLVIERNVTVRFMGVNIDTDDSHNFVLAREGPPYGYMGGQGMMGGGYNSSSYGFMSMMPYVSPSHSGEYSYYNVTYNFSSTGSLWYLCTYPGHAENGMYGKITIT